KQETVGLTEFAFTIQQQEWVDMPMLTLKPIKVGFNYWFLFSGSLFQKFMMLRIDKFICVEQHKILLDIIWEVGLFLANLLHPIPRFMSTSLISEEAIKVAHEAANRWTILTSWLLHIKFWLKNNLNTCTMRCNEIFGYGVAHVHSGGVDYGLSSIILLDFGISQGKNSQDHGDPDDPYVRLKHDCVAIIAAFKIKEPYEHYVIVVNSHICWDPNWADVLNCLIYAFVLSHLRRLSSPLGNSLLSSCKKSKICNNGMANLLVNKIQNYSLLKLEWSGVQINYFWHLSLADSSAPTAHSGAAVAFVIADNLRDKRNKQRRHGVKFNPRDEQNLRATKRNANIGKPGSDHLGADAYEYYINMIMILHIHMREPTYRSVISCG
nr:carbon catabolite repressor protein 4 homolog 4 isoform X1 [Tanacetum cinerariifolium]